MDIEFCDKCPLIYRYKYDNKKEIKKFINENNLDTRYCDIHNNICANTLKIWLELEDE